MAVGDLNGDGRPDILTSNNATAAVGVLLAKAGGGYAAAVDYSTYGGGGGINALPFGLAVSDVNGDGFLDAVTSQPNNANSTVSVLLGNGDGTLRSATYYSTGTGGGPFNVAIGDVTGDGRPDLVVPNYGTGNVGVLPGLAGGGFGTVVLYSVTQSIQGIALGDYNGDNRRDVAVSVGSSVYVLLGQANGTLGAAATYTTGASAGTGSGLATGDVNSDGYLDLVVSTTGNGVAVLPRQAGGTFGTATTYGSGTSNAFRDIALADVNSDGRLDIVTNYLSTGITVFLGQAGGFSTPTTYATNGTVSDPYYGVAVSDLNADGRLDLLAANTNASTVAVLLGQGAAPVLTSLSPTSGTVGSTVVLTGTNLTGATAVSFNGTNAPGFVVNSSTQITVSVPTGTTTGNVTVTTPGGISKGRVFTVTAVAPLINSFTPTFAKSGQTVTVTGSNLSGAIALSFSGVTQPVFTVNAAGTQLTTTVPYANMSPSPDLPSGLIQVTTPSGTANSATALRLLAVTAATDGPYPYGAAGENVILTGTGFAGASAVTFVLNSVTYPVTYTVVSETQLTAVVPDLSGATAPGGAGGFAVTNTPGLSGANFEVRSPVVSSLSPSSGIAGTSVTVNGFNFQRGGGAAAITGLTFNGLVANNFQLLGDGQATATVPAGATTGYVRTTGGYYPESYSKGILFTVAVPDLVVNTGTPTSPTPIPAGSYNSITVTPTGNGVLAGNVSVASSFTVQPGGGLSDGCFVISGPGSFTLGAGTILGICNAAGITNSGPTGAVQVTGTRSFSTGASYGYNTNAAVTGNGLPGTVANLAIITATNVTLTAPVAITMAVGVGGAGNLVLNGNALTLLSSASGTALVVNRSTGGVVGTATVQRYIDPSLNPGLGYRHYSAPVSGATVVDLTTTTGFTPVLTAGYNTSATPGTTTPFPTVFAYDQARLASTMNNLPAFDKGFVVPVSTDVPLAVGQGYAVNIDAAQLVSFKGTLTTGPQTVNLARTSGATAADEGWALVGNPYPAPLDLSLIALGDRPGLDAAMYVFESSTQYTGMYRSYVNSVGILPRSARISGALSSSPFIGSSQGFFVRVSAGLTSGSLTFRDAQRLTSYAIPVPVRRSSADRRPLVQLELRGATGPADTFYAYVEAGATPAFDSQFDAVKLPNTTGLNLASRAEGAPEGLAIDGRPVFTAATVLPLTLGVPAAGAYTLSAAALTSLPAGLDAYLHDALTGQTINLSQQSRYAFAVSPAQAQAGLSTRFSLGFSPQAILATHAGLHAGEVSLFPNPAHDSFTVLVPAVTGTSQLRAELLNALGQVVRRLNAALPADGASLHVDTAGLAGGVYILRLSAGPTTLTKRVVLQ